MELRPGNHAGHQLRYAVILTDGLRQVEEEILRKRHQNWWTSKRIRRAFVSTFLFSEEELSEYKDELEKSGLAEELGHKRSLFQATSRGKGYGYDFLQLNDPAACYLYCMIRKLKPRSIIETGVNHGYSSAFILLSLEANKQGKLYSIDVPSHVFREDNFWTDMGLAKQEPGWIVPDCLRRNWELICGTSKEKLPSLLRKIKKFHFFIHDSEHTYENMWFEYNESFAQLETGGILASDEIYRNHSFFDFAALHHKKIIKLGGGCGFIRK